LLFRSLMQISERFYRFYKGPCIILREFAKTSMIARG